MKRYERQLLDSVKRLIRVPSVCEEGGKYLFGEGCDKALDEVLAIMSEHGFRTFKPEDGAYAYAEIGEGELFGVLCHMDVVPAHKEDGWNTDPFDPVEKDGCLWGRGSQDDKGPAMIAAWALISLLEEGYKLNKRVRFIFGIDEETLWRSIAQYKLREEAPAMGFVPDADFPLIYAEKGLLNARIIDRKPAAYNYKGGNCFNAVSASASCAANSKIEAALKELDYNYHVTDGVLTVEGKTAHAKDPEKGINSNARLMEALAKAGYDDNAIRFSNEVLHNKFHFEGFTPEDLSDFSGPISVNFGMVEANEEGTVISLDMRLPVTIEKDKVINIIKAKAKEYGLEYEEFDWLDPIYVPLESDLIKNYMKSYREVTGDTVHEPQISAGATYARSFKNFVAFGANFPSAPTTEHQPNEHAVIEDMLKAGEVYRNTFKACVMEKK